MSDEVNFPTFLVLQQGSFFSTGTAKISEIARSADVSFATVSNLNERSSRGGRKKKGKIQIPDTGYP